MSRRTKRAKKAAQMARGGGSFMPLPDYVRFSEYLVELTPYEAKLLWDMVAMYRYGRNGDISATWSVMRKRGWKSKDSLQKALNGLMDKGLIYLTRQGGRACKGYCVNLF